MKFFPALILFTFNSLMKSDDQVCDDCNSDVDSQLSQHEYFLKSLGSVETSYAPRSYCKVIAISGFDTIKRSGDACKTKTDDGTPAETIEITFGQMNTSCRLTSVEDVAKSFGIDIPDFLKSILLGSSADAENYIKSTQNDVKVLIDFSRVSEDNFTINKFDTSSNGLFDLQLWCEGESILVEFCSFFTAIDTVKKAFGFSFKILFDHLTNPHLKNTAITEVLHVLWCPRETVSLDFNDDDDE